MIAGTSNSAFPLALVKCVPLDLEAKEVESKYLRRMACPGEGEDTLERRKGAIAICLDGYVLKGIQLMFVGPSLVATARGSS